MTSKEAGILRLIYETGFLTDELIDRFFFLRNKSEKQAKYYESDRRRKIRKDMDGLINRRLINRIGISEGIIGDRVIYYLTARGYETVKGGLMEMDKISIEEFGKTEERIMIQQLDRTTDYRYCSARNLKIGELLHDLYLIKLKIVLQVLLEKRVVLMELVDKNDALYREDKVDLVFDSNGGQIGIEYERSLKTKNAYIGRRFKDRIGRTILRKGFFEKRHENDALKKVIVVCENDGIMNSMINFMYDSMTRDFDEGKIYRFAKFFFISAAPFEYIKDILKNGQLTYPTGSRRAKDFQLFKWSDVLQEQF